MESNRPRRRPRWKKRAIGIGLVILGLSLGFIQIKIYFVRELLVAELLLSLVFGFLCVLGAFLWFLGTIGGLGRRFVKPGAPASIMTSLIDRPHRSLSAVVSLPRSSD